MDDSVLHALSQHADEPRRVHLRDPEEDDTPVIQPRSDEIDGAAGGRYQLVGEIARGGVGAVIKGRDTDLGRDVAMKVLLKEHADNAPLVDRFIEEAQIGGQLQHPGIAPVYEMGLRPDRRPYFTMKLVKGRTLAALLEERTEPARSRRRFLAYFLQVAQTVAYAHARGVIHRDLKPSNIMVGAFSEVQVMDWGLAKVMARGESMPEASIVIETVRTGTPGTQSRAGSVFGTPVYMPPEQARGMIDQLDERADVFALGAILCEILTGEPPYTGGDWNAVYEKALYGDLAEAQRRLDGCGAESSLVDIARACLATKMADRPRNAEVVAERVQRHLASVANRKRVAEEAAARARATASEERREREIAQSLAVSERRRRKVMVGLAAAVVLTAVLGGGGALWVKKDTADRAARAATAVKAAMDEANFHRGKAQAEAGGGLADRARAVSAAAKAVDLAATNGVPRSLRAEVDAKLQALQEEEEAAKAADARSRRRVALRRRLDEALLVEGDRTEAARLAALREVGVDVDNLEVDEAVARIRATGLVAKIAVVLDFLAESRRGKSDWQRVVRLAIEADDDLYRRQVREAIHARDHEKLKRMAARPAVEKLPPDTLDLLANAIGWTGDRKAGGALLERAVVWHPRHFWLHKDLGLNDDRPGRLDDALRHLTTASALRPESMGVRLSLARLERRRGQFARALGWVDEVLRVHPEDADALTLRGSILCENVRKIDEGIAVFERVKMLQPNDTWSYFNLANAHAYKAMRLRSVKLMERAIALFDKAIELDEKNDRAWNNKGTTYQRLGRHPASLECYEKVTAIAKGRPKGYFNKGVALRNLERYDEAIEAYSKAIDLGLRTPWEAHNDIGVSLLALGKLDDAVASYQKAVKLNPRFAMSWAGLAEAYSKQRKSAQAKEAALLAAETAETDPQRWWEVADYLFRKGDHLDAIDAYRRGLELQPKNANAYRNLGAIYRLEEDYDESLVCLRKTLQLKPGYRRIHFEIGLTLYKSGDKGGALDAYRQAVAQHPEDARACNNLADILYQIGDRERAEKLWRRGLELKGDQKTRANMRANVGVALIALDRLDEARAWYEEMRDAGIRPLRCTRQLAHIDELEALEPRLQAVLEGTAEPKDGTEAVALAHRCYQQRRHAAAYRLWTVAIEREPALVENLQQAYRYDAACSALLAASGNAVDAAELGEDERAAYRRQALEWLEADLNAQEERVARKPDEVFRLLHHWRVDRDLASVREIDALATLPGEASETWRAFWGNVNALLERARS